MWGAHIEKRRDDAGMQVCIVCIVCISVLDLVVDGMDGRTRYLLRYGMVWYGTVRYYLWAEKGCLYVCMRARVLGWAVLCLCGAVLVRVLGWAVLGWAVLGGAVLAFLSESNGKKR